ncbi:MAG: hypothetical protein CMH61_02915 [Nanoarchaeota archaeon]|nr:hypothetical protein [Nanoarchaeota archaeon]|tara:strand:- start:466 stop:777 length:312 start_codon:yes stop_codon:yes gene_type:complete
MKVPFPVDKSQFNYDSIRKERIIPAKMAIDQLLGTYAIGGRSSSDHFAVESTSDGLHIQPRLEAGIEHIALREGRLSGVVTAMGREYCEIKLANVTYKISYDS